MSYIRSTSNPEGLYIWSDGKLTNISHCVSPPLASKHRGRDWIGIMVPSKLFDQACKKWRREGEVNLKGIRIQEVHVVLKTGKPTPKRWDPFKRKEPPSEFLIRFSYKRQFVHLWRVTWEHVVTSAVDS